MPSVSAIYVTTHTNHGLSLLSDDCRKSSNRRRTSRRIISLPAMHLFSHINLIIYGVYVSPSATIYSVISALTKRVSLLSALINLLIVWARHTANI
jgi:hypothetical protein